jgi:hypothetical protein
MEVRELFCAHVLFALLRRIGRELPFVKQIFGHCKESVFSENRLYKLNGVRLQGMVYRVRFLTGD